MEFDRNPTLDALCARKSVRVFTEEPVPQAVKNALFQAAMQAPTAGNQMLYTILDITDAALKARLADLCDHQPFIADAPVVLVFVADVMGHGARAALVVATIRGLLEQIAKETQEPGEFMTRLNAAYSRIFSSAGELMFATACCTRFDLDRGEIWHANAGHPLPMVLEPDGTGRTAQVPPEGLGPALGLFGDARYAHIRAHMSPGQRWLFYTDGLTEARDARQEEFDVAGLTASMQAHAAEPLPALLQAVVRDVVAFTGTTEFEDDVCILGVDYVRD